MGAQLVLFDLRCGQFGVASFAQQRAVFRHYLVERRAGRRGHAAPAAAARASGSAAAAPARIAFSRAAFLPRAAFSLAWRRPVVVAVGAAQAETGHEDEYTDQWTIIFHNPSKRVSTASGSERRSYDQLAWEVRSPPLAVLTKQKK